MKKIVNKKTAVLLTCLVVALTGCGEADQTATTPTPVPTTEAATAPTQTPEATLPEPTNEPSAATQTPTPEPAATSTPENTTPPASPVVTVTNVEIESMEIRDEHTIVVTLNGALKNANPEELSFSTYNIDWASYKEVKGTLTIEDSSFTTNEEGKTVLVYTVAECLRNTSVVIPKSASNFSNLKSAVTLADNYITWQMDHGGWDKAIDGKTAWTEGKKKNAGSGWTGKNGELIGTIDNDATYTQIRHIAAVYREVPEAKYQESVLKGLDFLFKLQYESGGFAQVYPKRGNYSDNATFNDNAMINVLYTLEDALYGRYPFDSDIIPADYKAKLQDSIDRAVDFILKSQITSQGKLTAWCAQHDPVTYQPVNARAYELASISGSESVPVIQFLMNQEQTPEIKTAVEAAIQWFKDSEVKDTEYIRKASDGVYFKENAGHRTWYRFYEIDTNLPIFCDRDGIMKHDILEIGTERRHGYAWAGNWGKKLLDAYDKYGYVTGTITATFAGNNTTFTIGQ
ncbi:MAG: pectate lyase [Lachnospiraceae bacterium]|nr:pectate lyase [Lachnospiraceae bacterium]